MELLPDEEGIKGMMKKTYIVWTRESRFNL